MGDMWFRAVPVAVAGCFARKGDEVTGNLKVPQPARRRRGVTLIEAVLYIAVALALIVGGLVFYQQASTASRMNATVSMVSSLISETQAVAVESRVLPAYEALSGYLVTRGAVPGAWLDTSKPANEQIRNPWGGFIQLLAGFITGSSGGVFQVEVRLTNLPLQVCTRLLASNTVGRNVVMHGYVSGAAYEGMPFVTSAGVSGSISYNQAMTACRTADTTGIGANNDGRINAHLLYSFSGN
ncbi:MAG: hypothetical protein IOD01_12300 [Rhodobacter sp.]|nr:hypothetical protein [Rhodobacter sp.]